MRPGPVIGRPPGPLPVHHPTFDVSDAAASTSTSSVCLLICKKPPKRQSASPSRPAHIPSRLSPSDGGEGPDSPPQFNPKSTSTSLPSPCRGLQPLATMDATGRNASPSERHACQQTRLSQNDMDSHLAAAFSALLPPLPLLVEQPFSV
jgi:hypothetical protein